MAQLTREEFEARWQEAQKGAVAREPVVRPIQIDMSLSGLLDRYRPKADDLFTRGKISQTDHGALIAAITALKAVLSSINEKELVAQDLTDGTKVLQQQVQERINNLMAGLRR